MQGSRTRVEGRPVRAILGSTGLAVSTTPSGRDALPHASAASTPLAPAEPLTQERFTADLERWFATAYAYVSRRVNDRAACERIVGEGLEAHVDLLVEGGEERRQVGRLKASLDRLIRASTGTSAP